MEAALLAVAANLHPARLGPIRQRSLRSRPSKISPRQAPLAQRRSSWRALSNLILQPSKMQISPPPLGHSLAVALDLLLPLLARRTTSKRMMKWTLVKIPSPRNKPSRPFLFRLQHLLSQRVSLAALLLAHHKLQLRQRTHSQPHPIPRRSHRRTRSQ